MIKFRVRGNIDEVNAFIAALRDANLPQLEILNVSPFHQPKSDAKSGWAWVSLKATGQSGAPAPVVSVYSSRRGQKKAKVKAGYVYLLRADNGTWKIGKTVNPHSRKKTFGVKLPFQVEFEHLIECGDMTKLEKELHSMFAEKRLRGSEFFALTPDDVEKIKKLGK